MPHSPRFRPRRRPRILTRPSRRLPVKILATLLRLFTPSSLLSCLFPISYALTVHARVSAHDLRRGAAACSGGEFYDDFVQSLYSRSLQYAPPSNWSRFWTVYIRARTATYTAVVGEYWEGRTIRPSGDCPLKPDAGSVISRRATWNASRRAMGTNARSRSFVRFRRKILLSSKFFRQYRFRDNENEKLGI